MNKLLRILLFSFLTFYFTFSQAQKLADNTSFLSFGAGGALYRHSGEGGFGIPSAEIAVGRWFIRPLAIRVGADLSVAPSHQQTVASVSGSTPFLMGSAELMWDLNASFFHVYNRNYLYPIPFYPLIGLGLVYRPEVTVNGTTERRDFDFHAMVGLYFPYRISTFWDIYFEYKCFLYPQYFDASLGDNFMNTFTLGLTRRWSDNPYHRRSLFESRSMGEDWFFGIGMGPNFSSFGFEHIGKWGMYGFAPEIFFGRNYSEFWTVRLVANGLIGHERYDEVNETAGNSYVYSTIHADVMGNLSHLFSFSRGKRLNVMPYLGAGFIWRYDAPMFDMQGNAGVMFRYYIGPRGDLYADLRYIMVHPRIGSQSSIEQNLNFLVGLPSLTFGYIHNFGNNSTRYRIPLDWAQ